MPHKLDNPKPLDTKIRHNDWRDDLFQHGYVVVKGVIEPSKAQQYMESMFAWLEKFPLGFDRNNRSTWTVDHLPAHMKGGMYHGYSVQHEDFVWEARMEPGVVDAFAKLWGTDELLVSFDGINFTLPGRDRQPTTPWPHIDQSPRRKGLVCAQGIINFAPNGPDDGGLVVVRNSHNFTEQFFNEHPEVVGRKTWGPEDWFGFEGQEVQWFLSKGCDIVKVCADPGDLIIWDSRSIHYNAMPTTDQIRSIVYACYAPANWATEEDLTLKTQCFQQRRGTTHLPSMNVYSPDPDNLRLGIPDAYARDTPFSNVKETEPILRMAGVLPYQCNKSKP